MDRGILVYNPKSGDQGLPGKLDYIVERFQRKNILIQPYRINEKEKNLYSLIKESDYKFVIASGGDGTVNLIGNIILNQDKKLPMGLIPSGTCNDFASILKIPSALDECIDIILSGSTKKVDVNIVNDNSFFFSSFAGGIFVDASFNTQKELKRNFGPFAYYIKALSEVTGMKSFKMSFETENETIEEEVLLFFVLNGNQAGGFNNIIKDADYTDGLMDIVIIKNCNHIDLVGVFLNVIKNDNLHNKNVIRIKTNNCNIKGPDNIALSIDGEKGCYLPVNIRCINKAIEVFAK
ncbi:UNVERIFIED_CONTAM: YegS/Rv2252/BmrU family lipid kinase [Acetivibrio alkalicellulosi]